ncbi:MAG: DUF4139 domain-containing protein, partial [Rhodobacteraceae bacterium]|nr:DUF4139 domain-containing protein [Paracoccaceae bacterium]
IFVPYLDKDFTPEISLVGTGNATIRSVAITTEFAPPVPLQKSNRLALSETGLDTARADLRTFEEESEAAEAELAAAELQLDLLRSVASGKAATGNERGAIDPASLDAMVTLLGDRARTALKEVSLAKTKVSALARKRADLMEAVKIAEAAVEAATPEYDGMALLTIGAQVDSAFAGTIRIEGFEPVAWKPVYTVNIEQNKTSGALRLHRQALVQRTGHGAYKAFETWTDVSLVLSTASICESNATHEPYPQIRGLQDKRSREYLSSSGSADYASPEPVVEPLVEVFEEAASGLGAAFQAGQVLEFDLGGGHALPWEPDGTLFTLDTLEIPIDLFAQANAARDDFAYLYTDITNASSALLLEGSGKLYRNGSLIGTITIPRLLPGQTEPLGLGPLYGIQIERTTKKVEQGQAGFITSSSEVDRQYRTTATSALDYPIMLKLLDVVPVSQDEDLEIDLDTNPDPTETNRDGKRGVLAWDLDLKPGETSVVDFGYQMSWPAEKELVHQ